MPITNIPLDGILLPESVYVVEFNRMEWTGKRGSGKVGKERKGKGKKKSSIRYFSTESIIPAYPYT